MTTSTTETLVPSIEVLGTALTQISQSYQQLLSQPTAHDFVMRQDVPCVMCLGVMPKCC